MAFGEKYHIGPLQILLSLLALTTFTMAIVAMSGPWIYFNATSVEKGKRYFEVGLWQACTTSVCGYAWGRSSPTYTITTGGQTVVYESFVFYDYTPSTISSAQAFYLIGVLFNLGALCACTGGSGIIALALLIPVICYTIAFACAASFFLNVQPIPNVSDLATTFGYGSGMAALIIGWITVIGYSIDYFLQKRTRQRLNRNSQAPLSGV